VKPSVLAAVCACLWMAQPLAAEMPTPRDVLRMALQLRDVPLSVHPSCRTAGPDPADRTVGDYLAGFLAAMDQPSNTVETVCEPHPGALARCSLWLKHRDDEDRWAWGLAFDVDMHGRPLRRSVRCIGAG
jgi:hypothetical protein